MTHAVQPGDAIPEPGFRYPPEDSTIATALQARRLACCGLDPALWGDRVDLALLGFAALRAMIASGSSIVGQVHMLQSIRQSQPIRLGEPVVAHGRVTAVEPTARGRVITSRFEYRTDDGRVPVVVERASLKPVAGAKAGPAGGERASAPNDLAGFRLLAEHQLVPERVAGYSDEAGNLIHSDPEVARRFGFRAPIAAGLMAVEFMLAALREAGAGDAVRLDVRFRRPMFWDERLALWGRDGQAGLEELRLVNPEGRLTSIGTVPAGA